MGTGSAKGPGADEGRYNKRKWSFGEHVMDKGQAYGDSPYQKYTRRRFEGFDPAETAAHNRMLDFSQGRAGYYDDSMGSVRENLGFTGAFQRQALDPVTQAEIEQGVALRMNPYTDEVIDRTMQDYNRSRMMTRDATAAQAMGGGAFGGSRHGVADALTNEEFARQAGNMAAQLRYSGYEQALGGFEGERARLQAMRLQQEGMSADDAARAVGLRNQSASLYSTLGDLSDRDLLKRMALQESVGTQRRGLAQQARDFDYEQHLQSQQDEHNKLALLASISSGTQYNPRQPHTRNRNAGMLGGAMSGAGTGMQVSGGNPWGALAGGVLGAWAGAM